MADENMGKAKHLHKLVLVEWPEVGVATHANQLMAQTDGSSMYLTFCQLNPPVVLGTPEERQRQLDQLKSVKAIPIAKLVIPLDAFREMLRVIQESMGRLESSVENVGAATNP
jgi:hypothetical protein